MTKENGIKILISSYIESLLFIFVGISTILKPLQNLSVKQQIALCIFSSFFTVIGYFCVLHKFDCYKTILKITTIYTMLCIVFSLLNLTMYYNFINVLPLIESNSANGLMILICNVIFISIASVLKVIVIIMNVIKKIKKKT